MKYTFILIFSFFFITAGFSQEERIKDRAERSELYNSIESQKGGEKAFANYASRYNEAVEILDKKSQSEIKSYLLKSMAQIIDAKKSQLKKSDKPTEDKNSISLQQKLIKKMKASENPTEVKKVVAEFMKTFS